VLESFNDKPDDNGAQLAPIGTPAAAPAPSPTVLEVDRWTMRRADDIAARWQETSVPVPAQGAPVIADAHEALFSPQPRPAKLPADTLRAAWMSQLMETAEYRALHAQTCLHPELAEIGAAQLCQQWDEYAEQQPDPVDRPEGAPAPGADGEPIADTLERMRSTGKALEAAREDVDTAQSMSAGLGMGAAGAPIDPQTFREHFNRVRSDSTLRAILNMAGRMIVMAKALQRQKVKHGRDDVVGVELGGDIGRLIPTELLALNSGIEGIELLALQRIAERRAMCREYRGVEKKGRGPIIVTVDESGSMSGPKIIAAKALALAMAWLAHHQRRWIMLAGFSGGSEGTRLIAPPGKLDQAALMDWCAHFYGGGTTLDVPLDRVPSWYDEARAPEGKTDCILITDAIVSAPRQLIENYKAWAARAKAQTYAIVIGENSAGDLTQICERIFCVPQLDLDTLAVSEMLSI
jgi:uncharacterized protein with von Willebrand factor type A (vWA) domain